MREKPQQISCKTFPLHSHEVKHYAYPKFINVVSWDSESQIDYLKLNFLDPLNEARAENWQGCTGGARSENCAKDL